jgi:hypothetical protein
VKDAGVGHMKLNLIIPETRKSRMFFLGEVISTWARTQLVLISAGDE